MENSIKQLKWMVLLLATLNVALLCAIFLRPSPPPPPPPIMHMNGPGGPPQGPANMIIHELQLTSEQITKFEALKDEHQKAIKELREKGKELHDAFFDLLKNESVTEEHIKVKAAEIGSNQQSIDIVTFNHFKALRLLCTPEQKEKFDIVIKDIIHRMASPIGPGPVNQEHGTHHL